VISSIASSKTRHYGFNGTDVNNNVERGSIERVAVEASLADITASAEKVIAGAHLEHRFVGLSSSTRRHRL
jgi:hypothetical protein